MNTVVSIPQESVISKIFFIRGQKIMLDRDLANLYEVETRNLNKAVKRNSERFPSDFMFQLSSAEFENLKFQFGTSSWGGTRKMPLAFTEQGVAMLSAVLNSPRAINVSIQIIRTFTKLRELISSNKRLAEKIDLMERKYDKHLTNIFTAIKELQNDSKKSSTNEPPKERYGFRIEPET